MMQVYLDALTASAKGSAQYVLSRSLDLFRTYNRDVALSHLVSGWNIEAVCISGVMERNWMLNMSYSSVYEK